MARNVILVKVDGSFRSFNAAAADEHLISLGARNAVSAAIEAVFAGIEWNESGEAQASGVRFELGIDDPVEDVVAVVTDDAALELVLQLCRDNGWHATESSSGEFLDL